MPEAAFNRAPNDAEDDWRTGEFSLIVWIKSCLFLFMGIIGDGEVSRWTEKLEIWVSSYEIISLEVKIAGGNMPGPGW